VCGSVSAIGLEQREREAWPVLRERLRVPGQLMALMRGVLGDAEVATVVAVTPEGTVRPLAILTTAEMIAAEIDMLPDDAGDGSAGRADLRPAMIGDDEVQILVGDGPQGPQPLAVLMTPWIEQHLLLYARALWHRRRPR
jgi:hypothetical protein